MGMTNHDLTMAMANPSLALHMLDKQECEDSLLDFMRIGWHALEPGVQFVANWGVEAICDHLQAVTEGHLTRLLINVPPGCTKPNFIGTPVLTPKGWINHGNLKPGDYVFGPDGLPKLVEGVTPHFSQDSYKLVFNDKSSIVAGPTHEWEIDRNTNTGGRSKNRKRKRIIVPTKELRAGHRGDCIPVAKPIILPPKDLVIDPYLLGLWLGDGTSREGTIWATSEDAHIILDNYECTVSTKYPDKHNKHNKLTKPLHGIRVEGLYRELRLSNLLQNKHIPEEYLFASIEQRWKLLQGLMDTDGTVHESGGCVFVNVNEVLIQGVKDLVRSLGMKILEYNDTTACEGKTFYSKRLQFYANQGDIIFNLKRKQAKVKYCIDRTRNRYLKELIPVGKKIVNCIQVEGRLYLTGKDLIKTRNSMTTSVFWPAWEWGPRNLPHYRYINFSHEQNLAIRDNVRGRNLVNSEWYQGLWGDRFTFDTDQNAKVYYENDKTGWRQACPASSLTGRRGDRVIGDDPHSVHGADFENQREDVLQIFSETVPTRLNKQAESAIVVIMQRVHERDVSGLILEKELGYEHLMLPMEFEEERRCFTVVPPSYMVKPKKELVHYDVLSKSWKRIEPPHCDLHEERYNADPRTEEDELLDPVRFPAESIDQLKEALRAWGGTYAEAGQLQQRPAPRGGGLFQKKDFQYLDDMRGVKGRIVRGWDLAASDTKKAAFSCGIKMMLTTDRRIIIMDANRFKKTPGGVEEELTGTALADGYGVVIDLPQDPGQSGKSQKVTYVKLLHGYNAKFSPESGSKEQRAGPLAAQCEAGNVYLLRGDWNDAFINEATSFPNGAFKDQIDAASRAYANLVAKRTRLIAGGPKEIS